VVDGDSNLIDKLIRGNSPSAQARRWGLVDSRGTTIGHVFLIQAETSEKGMRRGAKHFASDGTRLGGDFRHRQLLIKPSPEGHACTRTTAIQGVGHASRGKPGHVDADHEMSGDEGEMLDALNLRSTTTDINQREISLPLPMD
jgi:hypothetical protein